MFKILLPLLTIVICSCSSGIKITQKELKLEQVQFASNSFDIELLENGDIQYSLYYDNNSVKEVSTFNKKGHLNGEYKRFNENGQILSNWNFKDNKLHGLQRAWKKGVLKYSTAYNNGMELLLEENN